MAAGISDELEARPLNDAMVDGLLREGLIRSAGVERAFRSVLRHWFLPGVGLAEVYGGGVVPIRWGSGRLVSSSSEPAIMARMLEQLDLRTGQRVFEVGTGSGYNAGLIGAIVGPEGSVMTVDVDPGLAADAGARLGEAGIANVVAAGSDGWLGAREGGLFDRIEVTAGAWDLSPHWVEQLRDGGVLVVPLWLRAGLQIAVAFRKEGTLRSCSVEPCAFVRLRGAGAGPEGYRRLGRWIAAMDTEDDGRERLLGGLLDEEPVVHSVASVAPIVPGWFTALALTDPDAVNLSARYALMRTSWAGLVDVVDGSLAVIETNGPVECSPPQRLLAFGGDMARRRLMAHLSRLRRLEPRRLRIEAVPGPAPPGPGSLTTIVRRDFTFVVR